MKKSIHHLDTLSSSLPFLIVNNSNSELNKESNENKVTTKSITKFKKVQITVLNDNKDNEIVQELEQDKEIKEEKQHTNINNEDKLCIICSKQFSLYTCPRCHIGYCSSICFKLHNDRCSNEFFEEQVKENLELMDRVSPKDSLEFLKRMKKIYDIEDDKFDSLLSKFNLSNKSTLNDFDNYQLDDDDEEEEVNDSDIDISNLNIDEMTQEQLLSLLTPEEIEEFNKSIKDGTISNILEEWVPWWNINVDNSSNNGKIIEINEEKIEKEQEDDDIKELLKRIPIIYKPIQPFSTFSKQPPSKLLFYHLIDIIYSYCYLMRTFNGDWYNNIDICKLNEDERYYILEGCTLILDLSIVLKPPNSNTPPPNSFNSIESILNCILKTTHSGIGIEIKNNQGNIYFSLYLLQDLISILNNKQFILSSLSHCFNTFEISIQILKEELKIKKPQEKELNLSVLKCYEMVKRKLLFFISWINEEDDTSFKSLSNSVNNYFEKEKSILNKKI